MRRHLSVIAGLDPAIHLLRKMLLCEYGLYAKRMDPHQGVYARLRRAMPAGDGGG
jgi:hypothetical protein